MYESNRQDGQRKLKPNAIPTLFSYTKKPIKTRKLPTKRSLEDNEENETLLLSKIVKRDHCYTQKEVPKVDLEMNMGILSTQILTGKDTRILSECDSLASDIIVKHGTLSDSPRKEIAYLKTKLQELKLKVKNQSQKERRILKAKRQQTQNLKKIFNSDQLDRLGSRSSRGTEWSPNTVRTALTIRFACGATGYQLLISNGYPLPSIRTLQRRVEGVDFKPGLLEDVFRFMQIKVDSMKEEERDCCLTLDEMSITPGVDFDTSTGMLLGDSTIINSHGSPAGLATHALVFMLSGVTSRWKQTVAYHFSGNSIDGLTLHNLIKQIIKKAETIGLHVIAVTSDMGSANQAMWREFGVYVTRNLPSVNKTEHPVDKSRHLYFLADVPHLIKNLKSALISSKNVFTLPQSIVKKYNLPSSTVSRQPLDDLHQYQQESTFKLAPKLTESCLKPSHFDKMKVSQALNIFSHSVSAGIRYMVQEDGFPKSHLTTAWFLDFMNKWFDLMCSRSPITALSKFKEEAYTDAINHLNDVIVIFTNLKIGSNGAWKPVQTGIILTTNSILELQGELLTKGYRFLLTSRFTQDCLENLFSCVRQKNPIPSPLEFKYALKMITLAQFLKISSNSNYMTDESDYLAEFLNVSKQQKNSEEDDVVDNLNGLELGDNPDLSKAELNSLYYIAGYCVKTTKLKNAHCDECFQHIESLSIEVESDMNALMKLKDYKDSCLTRPTEVIFDVIMTAEYMFRKLEKHLCGRKNIQKMLKEKFMADHLDTIMSIPTCHDIGVKLLNNFFSLRLRIFSNIERKKRTRELKNKSEHGSKSMAMHALVKCLK